MAELTTWLPSLLGWLDHWAQPFPKVSTEEVMKQMEQPQNGVSFQLQHGSRGRNFGFTTVAMMIKTMIFSLIWPATTDAPISQAGWQDRKDMAIREELKKRASNPIPEVPAAFPVISIPSIKLNKVVDIAMLKEKLKPVTNDNPLDFPRP